MSRVSFESNRLFFDGQPAFVFPFPVGEIVESGNRVFVRLEIPPDSIFPGNVYCFDTDFHNLLWQLRFEDYPIQSRAPTKTDVVEKLRLADEGNSIWLLPWDTPRMRLDIDSFKIVESHETR
jgi:hypothetical protein